MEKETKLNIMLWTFGILFFVGIIISFIGYSFYDEKDIKEVKCYDRFSNEIEGRVCTEEKTDYSILTIGGFVVILVLFVILSLTPIILLCSIGNETWKQLKIN